MSITYLKQAEKTSTSDAGDVRETVQNILDEIEAGGEAAARAYADKFDKYEGNVVLKDDIQFAHENIKRFAEAQKESIGDVEVELRPGLIAGQKAIPCDTAGAYVPGGRYAHIASALMTVTTARVAGCPNVIACSPPRPGQGIHPAIVYTADLCGADTILALGGVQGVAAMAFGLFGVPKADILVGPPVRCGGQAHPVRARRDRHDRRADRQPCHCR
jgi:sulfopropanediol 3-dehydrogenase